MGSFEDCSSGCIPLVHIVNISFSTGIFPSEMKIAKVIPLFKNGNKSDFSKYRPFSLLSQFSKILEKNYSTSDYTNS